MIEIVMLRQVMPTYIFWVGRVVRLNGLRFFNKGQASNIFYSYFKSGSQIPETDPKQV